MSELISALGVFSSWFYSFIGGLLNSTLFMFMIGMGLMCFIAKLFNIIICRKEK